jgi:hypothetical protein
LFYLSPYSLWYEKTEVLGSWPIFGKPDVLVEYEEGTAVPDGNTLAHARLIPSVLATVVDAFNACLACPFITHNYSHTPDTTRL